MSRAGPRVTFRTRRGLSASPIPDTEFVAGKIASRTTRSLEALEALRTCSKEAHLQQPASPPAVAKGRRATRVCCRMRCGR